MAHRATASATSRTGPKVWVWLLVTSALLVSCSDSSGDASAGVEPSRSDQGQTSVKEVCQLVKPQEVKAVLRSEVGKGRSPSSAGRNNPAYVPGMQFCRYDDEAGGHATIGLTRALAEDTFKAAEKSWRSAPDAEVLRVRNLGDEAVYSGSNSVLVRQDRHLILVEVDAVASVKTPPTPESARRASRERLITLTLQILSRLPKS